MGDVHHRLGRAGWRGLLVGLALLVVGGLLGACSGGSSSGAAGAPLHAERGAGAQARDQGGSRGTPPVAADQRAVVYTADMSVRAPDVPDAVARAKAITTDAGGYLADEATTRRTRHSAAGSRLVLKVPAARYQRVVDRLGREVGQRLSLRQTSQDRTTEVQDVDSRVASAKAGLRRLRKILDRASSVDEVLKVEDAISGRESDLESLQARQKALNGQTTYGTVDLDITGPPPAAPGSERPGFWDGLVSGWHALLTFLRVAVMVIGAVLPFAALAAVLAAPVWWWRRRRRAPVPGSGA